MDLPQHRFASDRSHEWKGNMKNCIVCHKFIKQPKYCPKHEPGDAGRQFINSLLAGQRQHDPQGLFGGGLSQQTLELQLSLRAQQFGGLGGSLQDAMRAQQFGAYQPDPIPSYPSPNIGPAVAGWLKSLLPILSWLLNPLTKLGLSLGILKEKQMNDDIR